MFFLVLANLDDAKMSRTLLNKVKKLTIYKFDGYLFTLIIIFGNIQHCLLVNVAPLN